MIKRFFKGNQYYTITSNSNREEPSIRLLKGMKVRCLVNFFNYNINFIREQVASVGDIGVVQTNNQDITRRYILFDNGKTGCTYENTFPSEVEVFGDDIRILLKS